MAAKLVAKILFKLNFLKFGVKLKSKNDISVLELYLKRVDKFKNNIFQAKASGLCKES